MKYPLTLIASDWSIPERTLRRWVYEGRLTATRKDHTIYVDLLEARQLLDLQHAAGGSLDKPPRWPILSVASPEMAPTRGTPAPPIDPRPR